MIDVALLRTQPDVFRAGILKKCGDVSLVDRFLSLDNDRRNNQQELEAKRAELNIASTAMASASPEEREEKRASLRIVSDAVKSLETGFAALDTDWKNLLLQIPNLPDASVPNGLSDKENVVIRQEGARPHFDFEPKDHEVLATNLGLLDMARGAKVSGAKFYYLRDELVVLEQAVMRFAIDIVKAHGFTLLQVPNLLRAEAFFGAGHFSAPEDAENGDIYRVERDELYLAGTAEVGLVNYRANETLSENELPLRYVAQSPSYRREAGTYGKETRGLYRVHQFQKVEMVTIVKPEESEAEHKKLLAIAEEIMGKLGLHYQVLDICGGDLGHPQVKKWDIEAWMPGMGKYGETHSCSNDTDFQARTLNIKVKGADGNYFPHTLNNTALASPRILVALLENCQNADGSITIPDVLIPYTGFSKIG